MTPVWSRRPRLREEQGFWLKCCESREWWDNTFTTASIVVALSCCQIQAKFYLSYRKSFGRLACIILTHEQSSTPIVPEPFHLSNTLASVSARNLSNTNAASQPEKETTTRALCKLGQGRPSHSCKQKAWLLCKDLRLNLHKA